MFITEKCAICSGLPEELLPRCSGNNAHAPGRLVSDGFGQALGRLCCMREQTSKVCRKGGRSFGASRRHGCERSRGAMDCAPGLPARLRPGSTAAAARAAQGLFLPDVRRFNWNGCRARIRGVLEAHAIRS